MIVAVYIANPSKNGHYKLFFIMLGRDRLFFVVCGHDRILVLIGGILAVRRIATIHKGLGLALLASVSLLAGCQGGGSKSNLFASNRSNGERPVQLLAVETSPTSAQADVQSGSRRLEIDEKQLAKAVERYRLNKKQKKSPYRSVGFDLDGDGQAEALTLLEGEDWCASTGCTLAIFSSGKTGYRPLATIRRVWGPVFVTNERNNGWSDLVVNTGIPSRNQRVRLRFGANGYPGNAVTLTPMPADIEINGEVAIEHVDMMPQQVVANTNATLN